ncbi:hypothetical protein FACS189485_16300 [Spirochaetia bacterium]|nr:hypothetical protein FACS189485_16300 [Spirochaetia bacterium]
MEIKTYENGIIEFIDTNIIINEIDDVFSLFSINNCSTIIIKKENIVNTFYDLSTGFAGELLQKFSNYGKRLAIIGDFTNIKSKSLKDFVYESNRTRQIIFVGTIEEALEIFNKK